MEAVTHMSWPFAFVVVAFIVATTVVYLVRYATNHQDTPNA